MDLARPFRGSTAVAAGAVTRGALYGPGYRRLYPDIHIDGYAAGRARCSSSTWMPSAGTRSSVRMINVHRFVRDHLPVHIRVSRGASRLMQ
jgi:hypothetical protein